MIDRQNHVSQELSDYDEALLLDRAYVHPPLNGFGEMQPGSDASFSPLRTSWAVILYTCCLAAYLGFLFYPLPQLPGDSVYALKASVHNGVLLCSLLLEMFLRIKHQQRQSQGYLRFYRHTRDLLSLPFQIAALSSVALLTVELWPNAFASSNMAKLISITICECCLVCTFDAFYLWRVRCEDLPDAYQLLPSVLHASHLGSRPTSVVEQQCEVIELLRRRCSNLAHAILRMQMHEDRWFKRSNSSLWKVENENAQIGQWAAESQTASSTPRGEDWEQQAASYKASLAALRSEKESLSVQNGQTWKLLEERTNEIHRLQLVRQQQAEENGRLRATLQEWSHRNVLLESRLNTMRIRWQDSQAQLQAVQQEPRPDSADSLDK